MTDKKQSESSKQSRRDFISKAGLVAGTTAGAGAILFGSADALAAAPTPSQTEGPFFPIRDQADKDADLTRLVGSDKVAKGEVVMVKGIVLDASDKPVVGAEIDVWQACESGRYNHPQDPNTAAPLDENFQYWAKLQTDAEGRFAFKTIKPGAYPATSTWDRPTHIHYRIKAWGVPTLTTQMYFKDDALNDIDQILIATRRRYGDEATDSLIVDFKTDEGAEGESKKIPTGTFTIRLSGTPRIQD